jgi:hypothetical protein
MDKIGKLFFLIDFLNSLLKKRWKNLIKLKSFITISIFI